MPSAKGRRYADDRGRVKLSDIVAYFRSYYEGRRAAGLPVEKKNSIFAKGGYTDKDAEEKDEIGKICDEKLGTYYSKIQSN